MIRICALSTLVISTQLIAGAGDLTVKNLPGSPLEDLPVCYDQTTGKLGNCPDTRAFKDTTTISVTCPGEKIQNAIDNAPVAGWVVLNISGTCQENVSILRSHTILDGGGTAKIQGQAANMPAVGAFNGADNIYINNISISDGAGSGLLSLHGATVQLSNSTIQNNASGSAVQAAYRSYLYISGGNTISGGSNYAVQASDGSAIRISGATNTLTNAGTLASFVSTIAANKTSTIRIRDTQTISNTNSGYAITADHGSTVRQDSGFATVTGDLEAYNLSSVMMRDAAITGDANLSFWSTMRFRDEEGDGDSIFNGTIHVNGGGRVNFKSTFKMNGNVDCTGGGSASGTPIFVSGSKVGC